jgi:hypothetical protein
MTKDEMNGAAYEILRRMLGVTIEGSGGHPWRAGGDNPGLDCRQEAHTQAPWEPFRICFTGALN